MNALKSKNMMKVYTGHTGTTTVSAVFEHIPQELFDTLTGAQLGHVMNAIDKAYKAGRKSAGAEMIDTNVVWVDSLQKSFEIEKGEL